MSAAREDGRTVRTLPPHGSTTGREERVQTGGDCCVLGAVMETGPGHAEETLSMCVQD